MTSNTQAWRLSAMDTVFFREGRAFQAGESSDVRSIFPPLPVTVQGIVRSKLLADHCGRWRTYGSGCRDGAAQCPKFDACSVRTVVGQRLDDAAQEGGQGDLTVRGPWPVMNTATGARWLLPAPGDLIAATDALAAVRARITRDLPTGVLTPEDVAPANYPGGLHGLRVPEGFDEFEPVRGWMAWSAWESYLRGEPPLLTRGLNWFTDGDLWTNERRPGVAIQPGRNRSRDQHLYFADHVRPMESATATVALGIEVGGTGGLATPFKACTVGGEMRAARIDVAAPPPWSSPVPADISHAIKGQQGRFKVVLTQPAWFAGGWRPDVSPGARLASAVIVAALVDRPTVVGGWDLVARREKRVRPYVPAGSVFYLTGSPELAASAWNQCLSESPRDERPALDVQGFGHAVIGLWARQDDVCEENEDD